MLNYIEHSSKKSNKKSQDF